MPHNKGCFANTRDVLRTWTVGRLHSQGQATDSEANGHQGRKWLCLPVSGEINSYVPEVDTDNCMLYNLNDSYMDDVMWLLTWCITGPVTTIFGSRKDQLSTRVWWVGSIWLNSITCRYLNESESLGIHSSHCQNLWWPVLNWSPHTLIHFPQWLFDASVY